MDSGFMNHPGGNWKNVHFIAQIVKNMHTKHWGNLEMSLASHAIPRN